MLAFARLSRMYFCITSICVVRCAIEGKDSVSGYGEERQRNTD